MFPPIVREIYAFDRSQLAARAAVRCLPGLALPLLCGIYSAHPAAGVFAAGGAMSVGFGSYQRLGGSRSTPMALAAVGMTISTFAGSWAGHYWPILLAIVALWGFAAGFVNCLGRAALYIGLQCVIAMLITSHYNVPIVQAMNRSLMVLLGGMIQTLSVSLLWRFEKTLSDEIGTEMIPPLSVRFWVAVATLRSNFSYRAEPFQYAMRVSVGLVYASALGLIVPVGNGYWIPMTAAIVLKSSFGDTLKRGFARIVGTLAGAAIATLLSVLLHPNPLILAGLILLFGGLSYLLLNVNYAAFAVCITSYVVFLLSLVGIPETKIVHYRTVNTLIGGTIALLMHVSITHSRTARQRAASESPLGPT